MKKIGVENDAIVFSVDENQKPYLKNDKNFHFNCAHSGQWIVCAVDDAPVGVDIERVKSVDFDIAKRFFSDEEYNALMNVNESERTDYFFRLWTLKESYLKAIGKGLRQSLGSFTIRYLEKNNHQLIMNNEKVKKVFFKIYDIDPQYALSVCATSKGFADTVVIKDVQEIVRTVVPEGL